MVGLASLLDLPPLADDLVGVEDALRRSVETGDPFLTEVAGHLIAAGGKRLRPALALSAAYAAACMRLLSSTNCSKLIPCV